MKTALAVLLALTPVSAFAGEYQQGYSASRTCFKTEYREEYVPGTLDDPGYVKSWNETLEVPCKGDTAEGRVYKRHVTVYENVDTNDCSEGTVAGGLLGGGLLLHPTSGLASLQGTSTVSFHDFTYPGLSSVPGINSSLYSVLKHFLSCEYPA